ncbi:MAG: hypothetical protein CMB46_00185 [Euryarchaeota archaeon]|jgi:hypothetical protein|nr:hypothetical protein [Euryarchaeota archaeon]|tara:strand:- start:4 stop:594 length:591 start_codon:yes stop_codon:yes gene_type:complete
MEEAPEGATQEENTLSGTPNAAPAGDGGGTYDHNVMVVSKSSLPQVMGILMMIYGVVIGLFGILGILGTGAAISNYEDTGISVSGLQTAWFYISAISSGLIVTGAVAYGGYETYNYKKRGVMIGLGAVAFGFVVSLGDMAITADIVEQYLELSGGAEVEGLGGIVAGVGVVMSLVCSAICGLLVALPLIASADSLE